MDEAISEIIDFMESGGEPDARWLDRLLRGLNRKSHDPSRHVAKRRLLPYYLQQKAKNTDVWRSWGVDEATDDAIVALLRAKPRRTASGVATVTVLMKPWPCASDCLYCPSDVRMPKSYLADEPACQRAEHNFFDPYLQVASRVRVLADMGHNVDKVELIVLGGTFGDYPQDYRTWFVKELFRALNELGEGRAEAECAARVALYESAGFMNDPKALAEATRETQALVNAGELGYNEAVGMCNLGIAPDQRSASLDGLSFEHERNVEAAHRVVGLVVETRPDCITRAHLEELRLLGCTKVQMGLQSLTPEVLAANARGASLDHIVRAFALLREYGFKSHVHFMTNLLGSAPESDLADFVKLTSDARFLPDEVKLYPCALVESSRLMERHAAGDWSPYSEEDLVRLLAECVLATPPYTRISRMIRDIPSTDIVAGNKKTNLRQMVEDAVRASGRPVAEMRMREIATSDVRVDDLRMEEVRYETSNTREAFLQWVDGEGRLAGFLRLSLPDGKTHAMVREVHVYGRVSRLHESKEGAQHSGLGRALVERACEIAAGDGRTSIKVISAVGTRGYYRSLGFADGRLYQEKRLQEQQHHQDDDQDYDEKREQLDGERDVREPGL